VSNTRPSIAPSAKMRNPSLTLGRRSLPGRAKDHAYRKPLSLSVEKPAALVMTNDPFKESVQLLSITAQSDQNNEPIAEIAETFGSARFRQNRT
jgi:hypothetical protein